MDKKVTSSQEAFLSVGEAAAELGVTAATLRNWDKAGKLIPRRHPINGYRIYSTFEIEDLKNEIYGKDK